MAKIMLFIDGTWLYSNTPRLAELNFVVRKEPGEGKAGAARDVRRHVPDDCKRAP